MPFMRTLIACCLCAIVGTTVLRAERRTIESDLQQVRDDFNAVGLALEAYAVDHQGQYPPIPVCSEPRSHLILLTTPVAYLNSLPQDPFQTTTNTQTWTNGRFAYYYMTPPAASFCWNGWAGTFRELPNGDNAKWVLVSPGPNYAYDINNTFRNWSVRLVYDPTNGATSYGDIFQFSTGSTRVTNWLDFQ